MKVALLILSYLLVIYVTYTLIRRSPWVVLGVFVLAPLVSIPFLINSKADVNWFVIAKTYTIVVYLLWIQATRMMKKLSRNKIMLTGIYLLLVINILEAIMRDFQIGSYLNSCAGIFLCITIPLVKDIHIDKEAKHNDLIWNMSRLWVLAYTLWNITFVYGNFPHGPGVHLAVLGVPLMVGLINPKIWLQARVITLATHMMLRLFLNDYVQSMYFSITRETSFFMPSLWVLQSLALILNTVCLLMLIKALMDKKKSEEKAFS